MNETRTIFEYPEEAIDLSTSHAEGLILDVGGGGEGVIGQLYGKDVVAIDLSRQELEDTPA